MEIDPVYVSLKRHYLIFMDLSEAGDSMARLEHLAVFMKRMGAGRATRYGFTLTQDKHPDINTLANDVGSLLEADDFVWIISPTLKDKCLVVSKMKNEDETKLAVDGANPGHDGASFEE